MPTDRAAGAPVTSFELLSAPEDKVIRTRGLQVLGDRLAAIAEIGFASMRASEPSYRRPSDDIQLATSIKHVLRACNLPPEERKGTIGWPTQIGRRRAQQGVPLDAMHRAYHIGGQALITAFMEWTAEEELPHERAALLAGDLWNVVDLHYAAASAAFKSAQDEIFGGQRAGELLDALLGGEADRDCIAEVTRDWGWAEHARYAVVVQRPSDWTAPPVTRAELSEKVAGIRPVWRVYTAGYAVGVVTLGDTPVATLTGALPVRPGRRTGVSLVVGGLADLGRARRLAELAVRTVADGDGIVSLEDRLPAALLTARPDLAAELCNRVLAPVLALDRVSRDLLLDTLATWLAAGGSADQAAAAMFCHRNTVLNRIRRLERLTKKSLSAPTDVVELGLALEAYRQRGAYLKL
jgi:hypothetical protein